MRLLAYDLLQLKTNQPKIGPLPQVYWEVLLKEEKMFSFSEQTC